MSIEEALKAHCTTYPALAALIGDRFEPLQIAQFTEFPGIAYGRVGIRPMQHRSSARANYGRTRFQFELWDENHTGVVLLRGVFKDAMAAFAQDFNPRVDVSLLQDDRDAYEAEPGRWRAIVDYHIYHTEA